VKIKDIATLLDGEVSGDPDIEIKDVKGIEDAGEGDITFAAGRKMIQRASESTASCILVGDFIPDTKSSQLKVKDPQYAFMELLSRYHPVSHPSPGIDSRAFVHEEATMADDVSLQAFAYISSKATVGRGTVIYPGVFVGEGVTVGEECVLYPGVVLMHGVTVGNGVTIHSNSVIGSDGFGYVQRNGKHMKVPQVGGVIIGDDVEIGAAVTIDRATAGNTVIGSGTKIDNLVQVAHNVKVGENSILVAQVAIAGSTTVGNNVVLGGQAGIADHVNIEDGTMIAAKGGVMSDLKKGIYSGVPVQPHRDWLRASALFARLPELYKRLTSLEEKIHKSEGGRDDDGHK
jgi:UDP-3-O-[3-hydroxymyristoyl] glucosamine N-acyltransferase